MGHLTSICNQENALQMCSQVNLMETILLLRFFLHRLDVFTKISHYKYQTWVLLDGSGLRFKQKVIGCNCNSWAIIAPAGIWLLGYNWCFMQNLELRMAVGDSSPLEAWKVPYDASNMSQQEETCRIDPSLTPPRPATLGCDVLSDRDLVSSCAMKPTWASIACVVCGDGHRSGQQAFHHPSQVSANWS